MSAPPCVDCGRACACVYARDGARRCSPCAGVGCLYCKTEAAARPTGVPLTADNVADAEHCTDAYGVRYMAMPSGAWWCEAPSLACGHIGRDVLLTQAASRGTVVTKWRK